MVDRARHAMTNAWTLSDREPRCEACRQRPAVVMFDRSYLCCRCYRKAELELEKERTQKASV
jgi:hypothetical protein